MHNYRPPGIHDSFVHHVLDATGDELTVVALHRDQTAATRFQVGLPGDSTGRASSWEVVR